MNLLAIMWWMGIALLVLAGALLPPGIAALAAENVDAASSYLLTFMICLTCGGGFLITSRERDETRHAKAGIREITTFLLIWWGGIPLAAGLPFVFSGMGFGDGWYEAVAAITTTGAWLSKQALFESYHGMLWRAELQWLGGLVSLSAAAAVFVRPQFIGIDILNTPFAKGENESFLRAFRHAIATFLPAYTLISLIIFIFFVSFQTPVSDALLMALSLTASGGLVPSPEGFAGYGRLVPIAGGIAMILGGISFVSMAKFLSPYDKALRFRDDRETPVFLVLIVLLAVIFAVSAQAPFLLTYGEQFLNAASLLSTNGIITGTSPALTPALVTAIIGGASISAAGGIKLIRWLVTFERAGEEIWQLIHPSGVLGRRRAVNELGVWVHFVAFTIILSSLVLVITIFGTPLETSVTAAVAVISNAGPMISLAPGDIVDYDAFPPQLRIILAIGMIIGRVEMVVALSVLNRHFWRS